MFSHKFANPREEVVNELQNMDEKKVETDGLLMQVKIIVCVFSLGRI